MQREVRPWRTNDECGPRFVAGNSGTVKTKNKNKKCWRGADAAMQLRRKGWAGEEPDAMLGNGHGCVVQRAALLTWAQRSRALQGSRVSKINFVEMLARYCSMLVQPDSPFLYTQRPRVVTCYCAPIFCVLYHCRGFLFFFFF